MKLRTTLLTALACVTALALAVPPATGAAANGPVKVGTDDEGDWGGNTALTETPAQAAGGPSGQDLVAAQIGMADKKTVNFIITLAQLPPPGGVPEFVRYIWSADVDGEYVELDGKFTNYTRGACDPTSNQCPPPRDPGTQPFIVRGNCTTDETANVTTCEELGIVQATFDDGAATITIPVPLKMINAKGGSKIGPGSAEFTQLLGGHLVAVPSAFLSFTAYPGDGLVIGKTFTVPGGRKGKKKK